jgi:hypothetical protein
VVVNTNTAAIRITTNIVGVTRTANSRTVAVLTGPAAAFRVTAPTAYAADENDVAVAAAS